MSLLVIGGNNQERKEKALKIGKEQFQSKNFDLQIYPKEEAAAITIQETKEAKRKSLLKPFNSRKQTFIFLELNKARLEAQNALLKLIEEPPKNTEIIITSPSQHLLPQPIVSRCQIIKIKSALKDLFPEKKLQLGSLLIFLLSAGIRDRFEKAEKISKDKETAFSFLKQTILEARTALLAKKNVQNYLLPKNQVFDSLTTKKLILMINKLQKALLTLENTNTSQRLLLENLLLEFKV